MSLLHLPPRKRPIAPPRDSHLSSATSACMPRRHVAKNTLAHLPQHSAGTYSVLDITLASEVYYSGVSGGDVNIVGDPCSWRLLLIEVAVPGLPGLLGVPSVVVVLVFSAPSASWSGATR